MPSHLAPSPAWAPRATRATAHVAIGLLIAVTAALELHAQSPVAAPRDPWTFDAQYLHWNAGDVRRHATPSFEATLGRAAGDAGVAGANWRIEAGWLRAVRATTTAQGATLGLSAGIAVPGTGSRGADASPRLTVRPGIALLAGWAEAQDSTTIYDWRGLPGTAAAGTTGSEYTFSTTRGATMGVGMTLGAELRITRAIALSASARHWMFSGGVIAPNRQSTLIGLGAAMHPALLAHDVRRAWHAMAARDDQSQTHHARAARATAHGADLSIDAETKP